MSRAPRPPRLALLASVLALAVVTPAAGIIATAAAITGTTGAAAGGVAGLCGPGGPARQVDGVDLDAEQLANARTITTTTAQAGMPRRAALVAVATAVQESSLRNLGYGDRDSLGLFQQRGGWGPAAVRLNPVSATWLFLRALAGVPGWQLLPVTVASDRVQHSAHPDAVARWEALAGTLVAAYWPPTVPPDGTGPAGTAPTDSPTNPPTWPAADCPGQGGDGGRGDPGGTTLPPGYQPPTDAQLATVVRFALAQLGEPYLWGGAGPDAWDCSGLVQAAWAAAGVAIPRTTSGQVSTGIPVASTAAARPGDLIFIAGSDGTNAHPGHVGMYIGPVAGTPTLVAAPRTGLNVQTTPLSAWRGLVVAIRRPIAPRP
ncbi:MAG TPA: NlpC/P60 family protein [Dermatophilaceae bacterium]|nr:NlpC/P60 family protein [Dermatophilaceae bacterium]